MFPGCFHAEIIKDRTAGSTLPEHGECYMDIVELEKLYIFFTYSSVGNDAKHIDRIHKASC